MVGGIVSDGRISHRALPGGDAYHKDLIVHRSCWYCVLFSFCIIRLDLQGTDNVSVICCLNTHETLMAIIFLKMQG